MNPMKSKLLQAACILLATLGCDEESERYEHLNKLRTLGVASAPVVGKPSTEAEPQTVTFTVFAAVPPGTEVSAAPLIEEKQAQQGIVGIPPLAVELVAGTEKYEEHPSFRIFSAQLSATLPPVEGLLIPPQTGFARLRYSIRLVSGAEEEKIIGTFLVYPPDAPEQAWAKTPPSVDIAAPAVGATVASKTDLKALIANPIGEPMNVGWFVPGGKVKNRRARDTEWDEAAKGAQTVVVTARGRRSGAFTMKAVDVTVE